jgi:hypothetical protein
LVGARKCGVKVRRSLEATNMSISVMSNSNTVGALSNIHGDMHFGNLTWLAGKVRKLPHIMLGQWEGKWDMWKKHDVILIGLSGWWFGPFGLLFHSIWDNHPN